MSNTHDRWFSFVSITHRDATVQDFLSELSPSREGELFVVSDIRMGGVPYSTHHIFRRGKDSDSFASAFLIAEHGRDSWGMYLDLAGSFPRRAATDALGAIGLDYQSYGDRIGVINSLDVDLHTGALLLGSVPDSLRKWVSSGAGMVVISTASDHAGMMDANRMVPDFYGAVMPIIHIDNFRIPLSEIIGHNIPSDHIVLLGRRPLEDGAEVLFSGKRRDKMTSRRLHRAISKASAEYSELVASSLSIPNIVTSTESAREAAAREAAAEAVADETLLARIADLETQLRTEQSRYRKLSKAQHHASKSAEKPASAPSSAEVVESVPEEPLERTAAQKASLERQGESFRSYAALIDAARKELHHVRFREEIEESATPLDTLPAAKNWRNQTWRCLLTMNEYAEACSEGRFSGNFHEFVLRHPHPLIGVRRVAMRESDTVRDSTLYMKERFFDFDGESVPMEAHFKIDVSGKHPAPRMHFDEHGGVIRVGYIGAHLRTKRTN